MKFVVSGLQFFLLDIQLYFNIVIKSVLNGIDNHTFQACSNVIAYYLILITSL